MGDKALDASMGDPLHASVIKIIVPVFGNKCERKLEQGAGKWRIASLGVGNHFGSHVCVFFMIPIDIIRAAGTKYRSQAIM